MANEVDQSIGGHIDGKTQGQTGFGYEFDAGG